ncbi:hypothetical protein ACIGXQ_16235 [Streptomyces anulatus]
MNLSDVAPLFVVAGAVVTSVAAYKGVLLTTTTAVRTSASTRQHNALDELLGAVSKIQKSDLAGILAAQREFRDAYEMVQRTAPEPSDILRIAGEMNDLVHAAGRVQSNQIPLHLQILHNLRSNAAADDEVLESSGSLGWRHSREALDEVLRLHTEQEAALMKGRPAPDTARARAALLEDDWDELVVAEFLACGALERARREKAVSARQEKARNALSGLAAAKVRLIEAERSWVNNLASPPVRRRAVPPRLPGRRRTGQPPGEAPGSGIEPSS